MDILCVGCRQRYHACVKWEKMKNTFHQLISQFKNEKNTDYLTGLVNRRGLHEIWEQLDEEDIIHCVYMDVDNFKLVNDVYGHARGDELLVFVSRILENEFPGQLVVRMGGDEFVVICDGGLTEQAIEDKFARLQHTLKEDFDEAMSAFLSFSIGVSFHQQFTGQISIILDQSDEAMYFVKKNGKGTYVNYEMIKEQITDQKAMKDRALTSFRADEFEMYLQPVIYLQNSDVYAAKITVFWRFQGMGFLPEEKFIPVFEQYGVIAKLDKIVFEQVCKWKKQWQNTIFARMQMYVRVSGKFILQNDGLSHIKDCLEKYQVAPEEVKLCIEEEAFLGRNEKMACAVDILAKMGFEIAIENFGSASSFKVLQHIPAQILKLDSRLLPEESQSGKRQMLLLRNVISMGRDLKFMVVAQGIKNSFQAGVLANYGAHLGLGEFYGEPLTAEEFLNKYNDRYFFINNKKQTVYSFQDNLMDDEGRFMGEYAGEGFCYQDGVVKSQRALHFPGGKIRENVVNLPKSVMFSESYTICLWIHPDEKQSWTSVVYITYADGFMSLSPTDGLGSCVYRMKDDRETNEWFDIFGRQAVPGEWAYMCISYDAITGVARLYFNGLLIGSRDKAPNLKVPNRVVIGGDEYQKSYQGRIAGLEIHHCVLPAQEIERRFKEYQNDPTFLGSKGRK